MLWRCDPTRVLASSFLRFLDAPQSAGLLRTSDQLVAETTHNTHNRQISMPPVGFEPTISAGERPQTYALDRTATGTGKVVVVVVVVIIIIIIIIISQTKKNIYLYI